MIALQDADGSFVMYHPVKCLPTWPQCYNKLVAVTKTRIITVLASEMIPVKWKVNKNFGFWLCQVNFAGCINIFHTLLVHLIDTTVYSPFLWECHHLARC